MRGIVIGGGIGGLAAALALRRIGAPVRVFEQAPQIQEVGAGLSLWSNAVRALQRLGVADEILRRGSIFHRCRTVTDRGKLLSDTDLDAINPQVPCVMVHRADLQQTLLTAFGREHVTTGARCIGVRQTAQRVEATFDDGRVETADYLIGADGIHSVVRAELFGAEEPRFSGLTCWRGMATFDPQGIPDETSALILGPGFKMGVFRCGPGRVYWFLVHAAPAGGRDDPQGRRAYLLSRFGGLDAHPLLRSTLTATEEACILCNDLIDRPPAWPWGKGSITFLGDAIHPTTPNLGQGACQAIEDAVFLADSLRRHPDLEAALRDYEQRRRQRTAQVTRQSWQTGRMLVMTNPLLISLRNALMRSFIGRRQVAKQFAELLNYEIPELPPAPPR